MIPFDMWKRRQVLLSTHWYAVRGCTPEIVQQQQQQQRMAPAERPLCG